jgi:hypothetical protein
VPDRGPVSFVRVSFRITTPDTSALAISLVSPAGTEVPLIMGRGTGADFGSEEPQLRRLPRRGRLGRDHQSDRGRPAPFADAAVPG